jgi:hypothetical protein
VAGGWSGERPDQSVDQSAHLLDQVQICRKIPLRKVAESDRTQSDCETIGILEDEDDDEDDDDSSNSEFRLKITSAIRLASEGGKTKAGAFAYAPCESSGGDPNAAIRASDLVCTSSPP